MTILFSDIRAYSSLSERMSPAQVIELLNRYFGAMSKVIDAERGTIIEFEGDAILAVFGAPIRQSDHADRATRTALAMQKAMVDLNEAWRADGTARHWQALGLDEFRIRIGVHSGEVVVGNIGSETRTKYAVIGATVNASAGVEQLNKKLETRLLLTAATLERLQTARDDLLPQGSHPLCVGAEPVEVYTIVGMRDADGLGDDEAERQ